MIRAEPFDLKLAAIAREYASREPELPEGRSGAITRRDTEALIQRIISGMSRDEQEVA
jgi:hypothetical protein